MTGPRIAVLEEADDLSRQVGRVSSSLWPEAEVLRCGDFDAVDAALASGPFDVLVAGPVACTSAGLQQLRRVRTRTPRAALILAVDGRRRGTLRDTVRAGASDLLQLPVDDGSLRDALEQSLEAGPPAAHPSTDGQSPAGRNGTVLAVVSPTGGCGKTFFATNLAHHLQSDLRHRTCLLDLDLQFGEVSTALRLKPRHTISDLLSADADGDDLARRLHEHLEQHESGFSVLAAPGEPWAADGISGIDVARVIDAAQSSFDYVIIDTPAALNESVLVGIEHADAVFALATLDLPSVRNLGVMLSTLKRLQVPFERVKLLLNKVEPDVGIDVGRVERYFAQGFSMVIPYGREVNRSLNMGMPVLAYSPRSEVSRALTAGLAASLPAGAVRPVPGGREPGSNGRRRLGWRPKKSA
ncbi:MAG: CpaE family protein [Acidimicrobiales bacterium]